MSPSVPAIAGTGTLPAAGGEKAQPPLPARLLPHQLAHHLDAVRATRHESALDEPAFGTLGDDPIDYGCWWHETMEFLPWDGTEEEVESYLAGAVSRARQTGAGRRAEDEIAQLRASEFFRSLRGTAGRRLAELAVFAPLRPEAWIDGVIDLVVHDEAARVVRVIDWKTNRPRSGEDAGALLHRLGEDYRPQLEAYGACVAEFFPDCTVRLELYASAAGAAHVLQST
jgi:ATP-dependent exoDNAse (exonuclease V) beta subunit